jgi:hypothetical protein
VSIRELVIEMRDYAGFGPGLAIAFAVSLLTFGFVSRALGISKVHGWALVMSVGLVLAATITPSREALLLGIQGSGTCDFSQIGLPSMSELTHLSDASLNVLLFIPLGITIGGCPESSGRSMLLVSALVLPIAIELIQLVLVPLGRECQSSDVVDNVLGLVIGLVVGSALRLLWRSMSRDVHEGDTPA